MEGGDISCGPVVGYDTSGSIRDVGCDVLVESVYEFFVRVVAQNDLYIVPGLREENAGQSGPCSQLQNANFAKMVIAVEIEEVDVICEEHG